MFYFGVLENDLSLIHLCECSQDYQSAPQERGIREVVCALQGRKSLYQLHPIDPSNYRNK